MVLPSCVLLVETIVADLFCPYGVINREVGRKFTNHKLLHEFFILNSRFFVRQYLLHSVILVSRKAETRFT